MVTLSQYSVNCNKGVAVLQRQAIVQDFKQWRITVTQCRQIINGIWCQTPARKFVSLYSLHLILPFLTLPVSWSAVLWMCKTLRGLH